MKKQRQYKFHSQHKSHEGADGVHFFNPGKKYQNGDSFVVPNMATFIHDVSEYGNIGALQKRVFRLNPLELLRLAWWNKFNLVSIAKKEFHAGVLLLIQIELLQLLKYHPSTIIISDQITDLSLSLTNKKIILAVQRLVTKKLKKPFAVMTNNLPVAARKFAEWHVNPAFIFTPFNRFGYEMNPTQKAVEGAARMVDPGRIVAITPELKPADKEYLAEHNIENGMISWF